MSVTDPPRSMIMLLAVMIKSGLITCGYRMGSGYLGRGQGDCRSAGQSSLPTIYIKPELFSYK